MLRKDLKMKTLELKLKDGEEEVKVHLRLTCGGQRKLKEKYEEDTLTTLLGGFNEIDKTIDIFDTALNYKNNDNTIKSGEELYDLMVDNDYCGIEAFAKVVTDIAVASGIIKKEQANSVLKSVENTYDSVFNDLENVIEKAEKKDTPTEN